MSRADIDVSGVVHEARAVAAATAAILIEHTEPWFIGLLGHGSAVKGGIMSGWSDLDLLLFLDDGAFQANGRFPLELAAKVQRGLSGIDPSPFQFVSALPLTLDAAAIPLVRGAYATIAGDAHPPEATDRRLVDDARAFFLALDPEPPFVIYALMEHGGGRLAHTVRQYANRVWLALYHALTLTSGEPTRTWTLTKPAAVNALAERPKLGPEIKLFADQLARYLEAGRTPDDATQVIAAGQRFLRACSDTPELRRVVQ